MADPLASGTGFLPRFLMCEPHSTIHLKSGGGEADLRDEQVEKIWSFIEDNILATERDILILGDYNMDPERDPEWTQSAIPRISRA